MFIGVAVLWFAIGLFRFIWNQSVPYLSPESVPQKNDENEESCPSGSFSDDCLQFSLLFECLYVTLWGKDNNKFCKYGSIGIDFFIFVGYSNWHYDMVKH